MVRYVVNLAECGGVINWKQVAGIVDEKPQKTVTAPRPDADGEDGSGGEGMDTEEAEGRGERTGGIFDRIIAKWTSNDAPEGGDEDDEFEDGGGEVDHDEDEYDMDDDLIDNSELEHRFEAKARAHRARKRPNQLGGFYLVNESKNQPDESEEDEDDEDEDDEDEDEDEEEGGGGGGGDGSRKRRRRRKWVTEGEHDFRNVPAIVAKVEQLQKEASEYFTEGVERKFLPKHLLQRIVDTVEEMEAHQCALTPFFEHLEGFLKFRAKTLQMRTRNAMLAQRGRRIEDAEIQALARMVETANRLQAELPDGDKHDRTSFLHVIGKIMAGTVQKSSVKALQKELVATCAKVTKLLRHLHDAERQESMIATMHHQAMALFQENNPHNASSTQLQEDLLKSAKNKKISVPLSAFTMGAATVATTEWEADERLPRKGNLFDSIPTRDKQK